MNPSDFTFRASGRLVPTMERSQAFVPNPLPPPALDLARLATPLANASLALGELNGIGRSVTNPQLLIAPFSRAEAVASSKIEGTFTSTPELLKFERAPDAPGASRDTREVNNYNRALRQGLERIKDLPLSKRLLNELHAQLLHEVAANRGAMFNPGELRRDQNWIGARTIQAARYVPPPPAEVLDLMDSFEKFANRAPEDLPHLIKIALMHCLFGT